MPITDKEKLMIDNYITDVPEYDDYDEDFIDELLDREFDNFRDNEMWYELENE